MILNVACGVIFAFILFEAFRCIVLRFSSEEEAR